MSVKIETNSVPLRDESLSWTVRLSDKAPQKRTVVFLVAVTVAVFGVVVVKQPLLGVVGFFAILGATAEFWLGVKYTLSDSEAKRQCGLSVSGIAYDQVKRVIVEGNHVKLSPLEVAGRLDPFRGVELVTTPENHGKVIAQLSAKIGNERILGN